MKIKNIFATAIAAVAMGLGTTSCDYLDVVPVEQPSVNNTMDNYDQALGYLYQCYRGVTQPVAADWNQGKWNVSSAQPIPGNSYPDDGCTTDEVIQDDVQFNQAYYAQRLYTNSITSADNFNFIKTYNIWISSAIAFLDKLETLGIPRGIVSPEEAKEWKAEANFLIAYYHFCLLRRYGPIAIVDKRLSMDAPIGSFPGRMHYDYCVKWICDKLDACAKDLPDRRPGSDSGRATSTICKALKARIMLYAASPLFNGSFPFPEWTNKVETPGYGTELISKTYSRKKWEDAAKASEEALALALGAGQRQLYTGGSLETQDMVNVAYFPVDNLDENFIRKVLVMRNVMRTKESQGNYEHIWACQDYSGMAWMYNQRLPRNILPKVGNNASVGGWFTYGMGWDFSQKFLTKNGLQPTNDPDFVPESEWLKSAGYKDEGEKLRSHIIKVFTNREPRFYAWAAFDGGDYGTLMVQGKHPCYMDMLRADKTGVDNDRRDYCPTGIACQKWISTQSYVDYPGQKQYHYAPTPFIRLAELYLNLAECYAELGEDGKALDNINIIRRRAGATELTKELVSKSGKSLVEWARDERSVELFDELHRFYDVRRWVKGELFGAGARRGLNAYKVNPTFEEFNQIKDINAAHLYKWDDRMYLYPIDDQELYSNPQFVQSPGY